MYRISLGERMNDLVSRQIGPPVFTWPNGCARPSAGIAWKATAIRYADQQRRPSSVVCPTTPSGRGRPAVTATRGEQHPANDSGRHTQRSLSADSRQGNDRRETAA